MRPRPIGVDDVAVVEDVQLLGATAAGRIDGEQDGPGDAASHHAQDAEDLEPSHVQVRVKRLVVQDEEILGHGDVGDPPEPRLGGLGGPPVLAQGLIVGTRAVQMTISLASKGENQEVDRGHDQGGNEGREEGGERGGLGSVAVFARVARLLRTVSAPERPIYIDVDLIRIVTMPTPVRGCDK